MRFGFINSPADTENRKISPPYEGLGAGEFSFVVIKEKLLPILLALLHQIFASSLATGGH